MTMHITFDSINGPLPTAETVGLARTWFWATDNVALESVPEHQGVTFSQVVQKKDIIQIDKDLLDSLGASYFYPDPAISEVTPTQTYQHKLVRVNGFYADFRWDTEDLAGLLDYMPLAPTHIIKHPVGFSFMWRFNIALPKQYKPLEEIWLRTLAEVPERPFSIGTPKVLPLPGTGGAELIEASLKGYTLDEMMEAMDWPEFEVELPESNLPY